MIVAVRPASALAVRARLFAALEAAFPVTFRPWETAASEAVAVLAIGCEAPTGSALPAFVVGDVAVVEGPEEEFRLSETAGVDRRLRGIVLWDRLAGPPLPDADGEEVLAAAGARPLWVRSRGRASVDRVRSILPELGPEDVLYALLAKRPITAVALIAFLRAVSAPVGWRQRPLQAAFVFDDPNLRWRSYGFIDYRRLVDHADLHGYHAAMATIPLDAGRPHRATAALFARRRDRLSLVFHGNDHVKRELLRPHDPGSALAIAAQAIRRIERFERRWGLQVDRVMMPPHGMCSQDVTRALAAVGFDALCAIHPQPWTGDPPKAPLLAAWRPAGFVGGCAVIPRIPLYSTVADIALRAFLDHPVVIYGHHEDLAGGLEPLADAAARVNRLGDVRWSSVGEIALENYALRREGDSLVVRPYSRRVRVNAPTGGSLAVERPQPTSAELELRGWSLGAGPVLPFGAAVPVDRDGPHEIRLHGTGDVDPQRVAAPAWRPWPKLRRAGTEARDRVLPLRPVRAR